MTVRRSHVIWAGAATLAGAAAQGHHMRRIANDPAHDKLREPPQGRQLTAHSADGTTLHVEEFGPDDASQTVVLLHGWTEALAFWIHVIHGMSSRGFRVIACDLRGHGNSEPAADGDYSIPRFGDDLDAVLGQCVPEGQWVLVAGHSLGAMSIVSWAECHDAKQHIDAAALLNTGLGDLLAEQVLIPVPWLAQLVNRTLPPRAWVGLRGALPRFSTPLSYAFARYLAFSRSATPAHVAYFERMLVTCPPDVRADVGMALSEMDLREALPGLTVPTLVMAGEDDKLTPRAHAEWLARELPDLTRLVILPETGHMSPLERPDEVIEALAELAMAADREGVTA
jgi:pimeloyl-ACP methyl ester carboxylesterase